MRAIRYTILTEDKPNLVELTSKYFPGFTLRKGTGYYQGAPEPSAEIVIIAEVNDKARLVRRLRDEIKVVNAQQEVWLTIEFLTLEKGKVTA